MQWEIVVAIVLAIGVATAVMEVLAKRAARKNETKVIQSKRHTDEKPWIDSVNRT